MLLAKERDWLAENFIFSSKETEDSGCDKLYGAILTTKVLAYLEFPGDMS